MFWQYLDGFDEFISSALIASTIFPQSSGQDRHIWMEQLFDVRKTQCLSLSSSLEVLSEVLENLFLRMRVRRAADNLTLRREEWI